MGAPLVGYDGTVKSGANTADFVGSWEFTSARETTKRGPYIGDGGVIYKTRGGREGSGSIKGELRAGASTFRTALLAAEANGTDIALEFVATNGVKVAGSAFVVTEVKVGADAGEGVSIEFAFEANGAYTIDDDPYV